MENKKNMTASDIMKMFDDYNISVRIGDEEEKVYREIVKERNERLMPGEHPWTFEEWMRVRLGRTYGNAIEVGIAPAFGRMET